MADQRPMFRFRQPWMTAPPPPTPLATPQNEAPSTTTTEPNVEPSPLWSPKISAAPEAKPHSQESYQPTQMDSQLPSPSLSSPLYSATSQLPSPSFATPLFSSASQLSSPQSSATSQPPSPWQIPSQANAAKPPESSGPLAADARPPGIDEETLPRKLRSEDTLMAHEEPKRKTMYEATTSKHGNLVGKQTKSMKPTNNKSTVRDSVKKVKSSSGDRVSFQEEIRSDISKLVDKMATANPESFEDEKGSLVALVGKNRGASMQLGLDLVRRGEELKIDDENSKEDQMTKAVINNNVQDINNSILMNSFITERNPGVHLALHYDATELIRSYDKKGSPEAREGTSALPLPKSPPSLPPEGDP